MVVIGASGHAKVVIEIAEAMGLSIAMVFDEDVAKKQIFEYNITHSLDLSSSIPAIVAIGNNTIRKRLVDTLDLNVSKALIHPTAIISPTATIGKGSVVMAGAIVNAHARIGEHVIVNSGAVIEHDCHIQDFAHISPNASLAGGVKIGTETHIGIGATIIQGITIGNNVIVGAGAVVINTIEDQSTVAGVPAKSIK